MLFRSSLTIRPPPSIPFFQARPVVALDLSLSLFLCLFIQRQTGVGGEECRDSLLLSLPLTAASLLLAVSFLPPLMSAYSPDPLTTPPLSVLTQASPHHTHQPYGKSHPFNQINCIWTTSRRDEYTCRPLDPVEDDRLVTDSRSWPGLLVRGDYILYIIVFLGGKDGRRGKTVSVCPLYPSVSALLNLINEGASVCPWTWLG